MRILTEQTKKEKYDDYLDSHISNTLKAFDWLTDNLSSYELENIDAKKIKSNIKNHDKSKYSEEEYEPYADYFYGSSKSKEVQDNFDYAWLHHIHNNPHHWQYWVLINDEDGTKALDMPIEYIIEMICDWWSFSWKTGNLNEIFDWYKKNKKNMILSDKTRKTVERYLDTIKENL